MISDQQLISEMEHAEVMGLPTPDYPVPEKEETLKSQMNWLIDLKRKAVFFPNGSHRLPIPQGMIEIETDKGGFIYNPKLISESDIIQSLKYNKIGRILGYGIDEKPSLSKILGAVVIRSKQGFEKQSVAVDQEHLIDAWLAALRVSDDGDSIQLESPYDVILQRLN